MPKKFLNGIDAGNQRIQAVASPSSGTDATNKNYVDGLVNGQDWKASVRAATTTNGTLATAFVSGTVIDGVTLTTGDRILLKNQSAGAENGIYTVNATGAPTRATDADSSAKVSANMTTMVEEGTVNAETAWTLSNNGTIVLGATSLTFVQSNAGASYTADGQGIEVSGNQFTLELDGTTLTKSATGVRIGAGAAGNGLTEATGVLAVGAGTGITVAADTVSVDTSVVTRKFAANVGNGALTAVPIVHNLGTRDVQVTVYDSTTYEEVFPDVVHTDANTVTLTFATAPATAAYRCVVQG